MKAYVRGRLLSEETTAGPKAVSADQEPARSDKQKGTRSSRRRSGASRFRGLTDRISLRRDEAWVAGLPDQAKAEADMDQGRLPYDIRGKVSQEGDLRVAVLNVNGMRSDKIGSIVWFMRRNEVDVMILVDARLTAKEGTWTGEAFRELLGIGTWSGCTPYVRSGGLEAGGQLIVVGPKWGGAVTGFEGDRSGLGVATQVRLATGGKELVIMGTYWPWHSGSRDGDSRALEHRVGMWMKKTKVKGTPLEYVKGILESWCLKSILRDCEGYIIAGDFNALWRKGTGGVHKRLKEWANALHLDNGPIQVGDSRGMELNTRLFKPRASKGGESVQVGRQVVSGSMVDHILHGGPDCFMEIVGAWVDEGVTMRGVSDHLPLVAEYRVEGGRGRCGNVINPVTQPTLEGVAYRGLEGEKEELQYKQACLKLMQERGWGQEEGRDQAEELRQVVFDTAGLARSIMRAGRTKSASKRKYKGGWSPFVVGMRIHLDTLTSIARHMGGHARQHRWRTQEELSCGVLAAMTKWRERLHRIEFAKGVKFSAKECEELTQVTGFGPARWNTECTSFHAAAALLEKETRAVKLLMQGKLRYERRLAINKNVALREEIRAKGRVGVLRRALMGEVRGAGISESVRTCGRRHSHRSGHDSHNRSTAV